MRLQAADPTPSFRWIRGKETSPLEDRRIQNLGISASGTPCSTHDQAGLRDSHRFEQVPCSQMD